MVVQFNKEFLVTDDLSAPRPSVHFLQPLEFLFRKVEALPFNVRIFRYPSDRGFLAPRPAVHPIDDPLQNTHVLAEAGPKEFVLGVFPKPIHVKDTWRGA